METKHFGLVRAEINKKARKVQLSFAPEGKQPLGAGVREKCLIWALDGLADLKSAGYVFSGPEAVSGG